MSDPIESPEEFAERLADEEMCPNATGDYVFARKSAEAAIRSRDAAIRAEALEYALERAARLLDANVAEAHGYSNAGRDRALLSSLASAIRALADERGPTGCTPEQQAGPDARVCATCGRRTIHQICTDWCMACNAPRETKESK